MDSSPTTPRQPAGAVERARQLVGLFHAIDHWGRVTNASATDLDPLARELLDHRRHMTVTIEDWIGGPVAVTVLRECAGAAAGGAHEPSLYAREILLSGRLRGATRLLQYGIVRIDLATVPSPVARSILEGREPLGRVLIAAGVHRDIQDVGLLQLTAESGLAHACQRPPGSRMAGRVATIRLGFEEGTFARAVRGADGSGGDGPAPEEASLVPAVELLEILIPPQENPDGPV